MSVIHNDAELASYTEALFELTVRERVCPCTSNQEH
jgi:hypothetical protein